MRHELIEFALYNSVDFLGRRIFVQLLYNGECDESPRLDIFIDVP